MVAVVLAEPPVVSAAREADQAIVVAIRNGPEPGTTKTIPDPAVLAVVAAEAVRLVRVVAAQAARQSEFCVTQRPPSRLVESATNAGAAGLAAIHLGTAEPMVSRLTSTSSNWPELEHR